jgi:hypothetical protein
VALKPAFHEAGTWRGSDIAHAATIVANSSRLVHMMASSQVIAGNAAQASARHVMVNQWSPRAMPERSRFTVRPFRRAASDKGYLLAYRCATFFFAVFFARWACVSSDTLVDAVALVPVDVLLLSP